jgi:hypothetical protein
VGQAEGCAAFLAAVAWVSSSYLLGLYIAVPRVSHAVGTLRQLY